MSDSKKSLLGTLFTKEENPESNESTDSSVELQSSLIALADSLSGYDGRVDAEIGKFKKMLRVGTTRDELQAQVFIVARSFQSYHTKVTSESKDWFKSLSAVQFIDGLLQEGIPADLKTKLTNYRGSLNSETPAPQVLLDVIEILEPETDDVSDTDSNILDPEEIKLIAAPIVKLLNTIELEQGHIKHTSELLELAAKLKSNEDLCTLLEGVSELIIRSIYSANDQVEHFLKNLRERLEVVDDFIVTNNKSQQAMSSASDHLTENVTKEVDDLQLVLTDSKTLEELEAQVKLSLENIATGLEGFNEERKKLEAESKERIEDLQSQLDKAKEETEHLRENLQQQRHRAMTDPLTKLPNRHAYNERLHLEYNRWLRYKKPLCLVMADIDHFKTVNDSHGHSMGDEVLTRCAKILTEELRSTDFVSRFGGEEFVVLLPETSIKDAIRAMNKLRAQVMNQTFTNGDDSFNVTMSFGVATFEAKDDFNLVFNRADTALYRAKNRGRNQVCAELKKTA